MKKTWIIFLCLLAGLLLYCFWPEYGSGYSETQRRLWNEKLALYPDAWIKSGYPLNSDYFAGLTGEDVETAGTLLESKRKKEKVLADALETNRDRLGPDYEKAVPFHRDVSRLPLDGLTDREVAERALAGDGNACLWMVEGLCSLPLDGGLGVLSWRQKNEIDKWLDRAGALGRPGTAFLRGAFNKTWEAEKAALFKGREHASVEEFPISDIPGYEQFEEHLRKGDCVLFRVYACLFSHRQVNEMENQLYDILQKEAQMGDSGAGRDYASLFFNHRLGSSSAIGEYIIRELNSQQLKWKKRMSALPDFWREGIIKILFSCGVIDGRKTVNMKKYRKVADYARQAARQGDLTGMYLWLQYGLAGMTHFSAADWKDILEYNRILRESGYLPYLSYMEEHIGNESGDGYLRMNEAILQSFYSPSTFRAFWKQDRFQFRQMWFLDVGDFREIVKKGNLEEVRNRTSSLRLMAATDIFLEKLTGGDLMEPGIEILEDAPEKVKDYLLKLVEEWVDEGDIYASYKLAEIYEKGMGVPVDLAKAWSLYTRTFEGAGKYPFFLVMMENGYGDPERVTRMNLTDASCLKMAEMVLKHSDFTGRDGKAAYDRICEQREAPAGESVEREYFYYYLGMFHERGVGVPADRKKALEFYQKGVSCHKGCSEGISRLFSSGETAGETEKKENL